jgi:hypothetical protein
VTYRINDNEFQSFEDAIEWAKVVHYIDFHCDKTLSESEKQEACLGIAEFTKTAVENDPQS